METIHTLTQLLKNSGCNMKSTILAAEFKKSTTIYLPMLNKACSPTRSHYKNRHT